MKKQCTLKENFKTMNNGCHSVLVVFIQDHQNVLLIIIFRVLQSHQCSNATLKVRLQLLFISSCQSSLQHERKRPDSNPGMPDRKQPPYHLCYLAPGKFCVVVEVVVVNFISYLKQRCFLMINGNTTRSHGIMEKEAALNCLFNSILMDPG